MSFSISGTVSAQAVDTPAPAPSVTRNAPKPAESQPSQDSVEVSQDALISQLTHEGHSPSEISETLGVPVATVNLDLGIIYTAVAPTASVSTVL
jgi:hypothetical protein